MPSPLAQKLMVFLLDRLTASIGDAPGTNRAPAQRNDAPGTSSPDTCSAPLELLAPPSTTFMDALDLPPMHGIATGKPGAVVGGDFAVVEGADHAGFRSCGRRRQRRNAGFAVGAGDGERNGFGLVGTGADHDFEDARLDHFVHVGVEHGEHVRGDGEFDGFLLAGFQGDALESFQLHDRTGDGGDLLMNVELRDFVAFARAGVGDVHDGFGGAAESQFAWARRGDSRS